MIVAQGGEQLALYEGHKHESYKLDCCLTPSDGHVICGSEDGARSREERHSCPVYAAHWQLSWWMRQVLPWIHVQVAPCHGGHALSDTCAEPTGRVCYWELVDAEMVQELTAHSGPVCSLSLHPAGTTLVTASNDGTIKVWK